jgi:hypothetical protein
MGTTCLLSHAKKFGGKLGWVVLAIVALSNLSFGQSIPGTISHTTNVIKYDNPKCFVITTQYSWTFTDTQGGAHAFAGVSDVQTRSGSTCGTKTTTTSLDEWSIDGVYYIEATGASASVTQMAGYINPKYIVVGVTYAPPGGQTSSNVSYGMTDFVGTTTTNTSSFNSNYMESISVCGGTCGGGSGTPTIPVFGFFGGSSVTGSESTSYTLASNSSNSVSVSKQTSLLYMTPGVPNVYSPVNHDYDYIWIWVNPVVRFTVLGSNTSTSGSIIWNGYGYDWNDPLHEVDVWPVYVGYLNGDFAKTQPGGVYDCGGVSEPIDCQDAGVLARSWVGTTQTFAPGAGAGITTADYPNILGADPFAKNPGYLVNLASGVTPATTTDGRFTVAEAGNTQPQPFPYEQAPLDSTTGLNEKYSDQYSNSTTIGKGSSYTFSEGFGLDEKFGFSFFGQGLQYELKQNWMYTWMSTWQNTVTNTTTQTGSLSITGPPCPAAVAPCIPQYTEPHEFAVYQDNLYGTFMFWPDPYFTIGPATPASQTVVAGGRASYTISTAANAGYTGTLKSFNVAGLPSGATASFSQTTGTPGFSTTLTVSTTSATPAGSYPLTVSASDGSLSYFACTSGCPTTQPYPTLVVGSAPSFSISAAPASQTIGVSGGTTFAVTVAAANGFAGVVDLSVDGLPSGSSATFSPETVTGSGSSTLTLTTTASIQPGTYALTFTGTSGSLTKTTMGTLVVTGANFVLTAAPEIQAINAGSSAVYTVSTMVMNGFDGSVVLNVSGLPSGSSATFSPTAITGAGSSTLTITTTTATAAGDYNLTVSGTSGSVVQTTPITIEVNN